MRIRVIDYAANLGGGVRFVVELTQALANITDFKLEVVSFGEASRRYERAFSATDAVSVHSIPPSNERASRGPLLGRLHFLGEIRRRLGVGSCFHFEVPMHAMQGADVVWFPWLHRHRLPQAIDLPVLGSLHDTITLEYPQYVGLHPSESEKGTIRSWINSPAGIAVSAEVTRRTVQQIFSAPEDRMTVIPLSASHLARLSNPQATRDWGWLETPFLICPAGIAPHKNHEVLLRGVAEWGRRIPLVLTGNGTDLRGLNRRTPELRMLARRCRFTIGKNLQPLGYLSDADYFSLLRRAWALVMPTLAEGGGSFPVWEALTLGVPVVCSDIPVMREMVGRTGGHVMWFDPRSPASLADRLRDLETSYEDIKGRALLESQRLRTRSWLDVATDYAREFKRLAKS